LRALVFVLAASLSACIFFVGKDDYGDTCKFEGSGTVCGACISTKCKTELNNCCSSYTCELVTMKKLDTCAPTNVCTDFKAPEGTLYFEDDKLKSCVGTSCKTACGIP
jgi:hypothetical protein